MTKGARRYIVNAILEALNENPNRLLTADQLAPLVTGKVGHWVSPHRVAGCIIHINSIYREKVPSKYKGGRPIYAYGPPSFEA